MPALTGTRAFSIRFSVQLTRSFLQSANLNPGIAVGVPTSLPERVIQFGEGNFLRAFVDWMLDEVNSHGLFNGSAVLLQPVKQGLVGVLNEQDGLYTLLTRGIRDGKPVETRRIITVVSRGLDPYTDWAGAVELMRSADLRFAVSNTTEAGIAYVDEPYTPGVCQNSFPAKVTALLYERFKTFGSDDARGLIFLPCELIDRNGAKLREYVLQYAAAWGLPGEFQQWIRTANYFLNTLVDRIVPGYPREDAVRLAGELGYEDKLMVAGELFHLWVIEGPAHLAGEIPFAKAGLNVIWTDDMTPYRSRKVRVLNGAHTCSVLAAFLAGLDTVGEMMADPEFGRYIEQAVFQEIVPCLKMDDAERRSYAAAVLERFQNPFIRHELLSISLNSVSKWKVRVLPSLLDSLAANGKLPAALTFSLAALIRFYDGVPAGNELRGTRNGQPYPIRDDAPVLETLERAWRTHRNDLPALVAMVLGSESLWGTDLTRIPGLAETVAGHLQNMAQQGARAAAVAALAC